MWSGSLNKIAEGSRKMLYNSLTLGSINKRIRDLFFYFKLQIEKL